jgi:hypothetical protein
MASVMCNVAVVFKELLVVLDSQTFLLNKRSIEFEAEKASCVPSFSRNLVPVGLVWVCRW